MALARGFRRWPFTFRCRSSLKEKCAIVSVKHFFTRSRYLAPITARGLGVLNFCMRLNPLQRHSKRVRELKYLNVGCGKRMIDHMINLNYEWYPRIDLTWNILKPLPFADGTLLGIYTEHVLEHLPFDSIPFVLSEFKRVLAPSGSVRILVPDAELYARLYVESRDRPDVRFPRHEEGKTPMMQVNRCFRNHDHLFAYDFETMSRLLAEAGFKNITKCEHRKGSVPELLVDSDYREDESLRVNATVS